MSASTKSHVIFVAVALVASGAHAAKRAKPVTNEGSKENYENLVLPEPRFSDVPVSSLSYESKRIRLRGGKVEVKRPGIDAQRFLFERETFLVEKRDEAIKLLRQELDSGFTQNRDNILLRLGQLYTEKYMELNFHEVELYNRQFEAFEKAGKKGKDPAIDNKRSRRYLDQALTIFTKLENQYPNHPRIDEVLFFLGFVNIEFGQAKKGAAYLEKLVSKYPQSRKFEEGVLYLADFYFDNQRFKEAFEKYRILQKKKDDDLYDYASYKVAWCRLNLGSPDVGLKEMKDLIDRLEKDNSKGKFNLREQALTDLVTFFVESGKADEAFAYYTDKLGEEKAFEKLRTVATLLLANGKHAGAEKAYKRLLDRYGDSAEAPEYAMALYEAQMASAKTADAVLTLKMTLDRYGANSDWAKKFGKDKEKEAKEKLAALQKDATNAALFYHRTAQKSKSKQNYDYALELYSALVKAFPESADKRKLNFYQAEILYEKKEYLEASGIYMQIAKSEPKDKLAEEAAFNALLAVDQLTSKAPTLKRYSDKEQKEMAFEKTKLSTEETRFIEVADYYLKNYSKFQRSVDVQFRIASIYYRHNYFDEALPIFDEIATKHPNHKFAANSAHLVLDIYNIKKDYKGLADTSARFAKTPSLGNAKFKEEMTAFKDQIGFKAIEGLERQSKWAEAGEAYLKYYKSDTDGTLAEQALYNSVVSYEKSGDEAKLKEAAFLFMERYPKNEYNKRLILLQAKSAEQDYDYAKARDLYRKFYSQNPKDPQAKKALFNAAVFAELTEDNRAALSLYEDYLKQPGVTAKERKDILVSQSKLNRKTGDFRRTEESYRALLQQSATLEEKGEYLAKLAELYEKNGRRSDREALLQEIEALAKGRSNPKDLGPAVEYLAESRFKAVEPEKKSYERLKLRLPPATLVNDIKKKQAALKKLADSYDKVVSLGDPEWGVAALAETADAYSQFSQSYRSIPIPASFKGAQRVELERQMKELDGQLIKPLDDKAVEIRKTCVSNAVRFSVVTEYVSRCRAGGGSEGDRFAPSGILPEPGYWTTTSGNLGVARP